jgi:signal transduction histidine kinase
VSTTAATPAELRGIDLLDDLSEDELEPWIAAAQMRTLERGDVMAEQGQAPPGAFFILEGSALAFRVDGDRTEPTGRQQAPTWLGAISVLTGEGLPIRVVAETHMRVAVIPTDDFVRLTLSNVRVHHRVMERVGPVMNRFATLEQNRERLTALGTMAAGIAHELNNPAAAATRAAAELSEAVATLNGSLRQFVQAGVERVSAEKLVALQEEAAARAASCTALDTLAAADAEDDLATRLEELGVEEPWRIAEPLAAANVDEAWLDQVAEHAGPATGAALSWVAATLQAQSLIDDLSEATRRMSDLVAAVKRYTYMDRGDLVEIDLHQGIEDTLKVLHHKLRHTAIEVVRDYDETLPKLTVRGFELNQVWTNLLDNAIAALGERGTITIRTFQAPSCARVDISDDGPGIPQAIQSRVFDPFFTTKEVGQGTGMGLELARRIVVDRHDGSLWVDSQPGSTTFHVSLPFTQA